MNQNILLYGIFEKYSDGIKGTTVCHTHSWMDAEVQAAVAEDLVSQFKPGIMDAFDA